MAGHPGAARPRPRHIDDHATHQLPACPDCGGRLTRTGRTRTRRAEDIPDDLRPEVTEHTIHRDGCPCGQTQVEPPVPDALPNGTPGHRTVVPSAWPHYGLGVTTRRIVDVFGGHLRLPLTDGGRTQMWHRLAGVLGPWYERIRRHGLDAGVLHADETGWRVEGRTWWRWCSTCADATYYLFDPSRGHPALDEFVVREFAGVPVTDFWAAYDAVGRAEPKCGPHLLRELTEVDAGSDNGGDWAAFAKRLRRVYGDAVRLELTRGVSPSGEYDMRLSRLHGRIVDLSTGDWSNPHAVRLAKRVHEYGAELLTFVEFEGVPSSNNHAEREVRPAVLMRKASYGSQSARGAATRGVRMSVCRTLKNRGRDPLQTILDALRNDATTGTLPPRPELAGSEGEGLRKNDLKPWLKQQWVIPPDGNAAFAAAMEDVIDVYHRPPDPEYPVVCVGEGTKQLVGDVRDPLPVRVGSPAKEDYEYERHGVANLFVAFEPLAGRWR